MNSSDLHVVLGASGGLGSAVVRELVKQEKRVRAVSRSAIKEVNLGNQVEVVQGDITNVSQMSKICQGASVIYHCTNAPYPEWVKALPPMMTGVISGAVASGAKVVYGDNLYMYGQVTGPITTDLPDRATGHKGLVRAQLANELMKAHQAGKIRATIGRASDFFGPNVLNSMMGEVVFQALVEGKTLNLIGKLDVPHTYTFVEDFAKGLVTLGERAEADGEIWHIPSAETITTQQFLDLIFVEAQQTPKLRTASPMMLNLLGLFSPMLREIKEISYEFEQPFVVDHRKYERVFGSHSTPHREAIRKTISWFRDHHAQSAT
ncbi:SDR family oxidoreductase [Chamaesiphon sp. OTE_75_metabat_556]|uniref:SDR family oxidoreductase n=1 Tax=Chamaesiphon sp. OTE_75_metabat_556 TaxID=2964692 RepID=UPI00286CAD00|nr:SDR family oxidoreductase [Chamaesiphon sp. OTE_75_metabat_556]